jgi:hypothetical protein
VTRRDNQSFAFLSKLVKGLIIVFPNNAFKVIIAWAQTSDFILQHSNELYPFLPPALPNPADATLQEICTCKFIYLPAVCIPLFLAQLGILSDKSGIH